MPPVSKSYFNDYANVVDRSTARQLNQRLQQYERDTSNQIVVAIFPKMQSDSSIEDYTQRVADSWKVGQKGKDNGAVLFVFVQDRSVYIQVGYGLEGALPDATAKQIIENEIIPRFRAGDYTAGVSAGANAMMAATRGEYKGAGRTVGERQSGSGGSAICLIIAIIIVLSIVSRFSRRRGYMYDSMGPFIIGGMLGSRMGRRSSGWGGFGGRGGGFGGFGGFSGGGGSFGGGGAGGRW